jgi:putative phosphoribosyl transferase
MDSAVRFQDRAGAGGLLATKLLRYSNCPDVVVLAIPRGGVPVAFEVAKRLNVSLDVVLVRKLGVPEHQELAMGAVALGDVRVLQSDVIQLNRISAALIEEVATRELKELTRRNEMYRDSRPAPEVRGKTIILVDDGLATGSTMRAAAKAVKVQKCGRIVVAVPIAAFGVCEELKSQVDEIICAHTPKFLQSVGHWYENFTQITDDEVRKILMRAKKQKFALASNEK